jgi:hypothetical protein
MSKVIEFLARMGQEANTDIESLLAQADMDVNQSKAIINKDVTSLERQLDICPDIKCFIIPAEDDEPVDDQESENETTSNAIGF